MKIETFLQAINLEKSQVEKIYGEKQIEDLKDCSKLYFFTGKGNSNKTYHLGHFLLNCYLSKISSKYPVVYQLSGDEKRNLKNKFITLDKAEEYRDHVIKVLETFPWVKLLLIDNLEPNTNYLLHSLALALAKFIRVNTVKGAFGNVNVWTSYYTVIQLAPILLYQVLNKGAQAIVITAEDQIPFFCLLRDISSKLKLKKPIILKIKPLLDTQMKEKMSASNVKGLVNVNKENVEFKSLKKAVSAPVDPINFEKDFCAHLCSCFINLNINSQKFKLELETYNKDKSALNFKIKVGALLDEIIVSSDLKMNLNQKKIVPSSFRETKELIRKIESFLASNQD